MGGNNKPATVSDKWSPAMNVDRHKLVQAVHLAVIALVGGLSALRYYLVGFAEFPFPAIVTVSGCVANALFLARTGSVTVSARILLCLLHFGLLTGGVATYGFQGPVVLLSPLLPVLAVVLLDSRAAWWSVVSVVVILLGLFLGGVLGWIPDNPYSYNKGTFGRFAAVVSLCLMMTWTVWQFAVVSRRLLVKLDEVSRTDYLTGTLNRRGIELLLAHEVGRAQRNNSWMSVVMVDIDHFKRFNDANGHPAGDACLVDIVREVGNCLNRATDTVGRYGGEEFIVLLPDTDPDGARLIGENIRCRIMEKNIPYEQGRPGVITATLGVVCVRGKAAASGEAMIARADEALYRGKSAGRNVVMVDTMTAQGAAAAREVSPRP